MLHGIDIPTWKSQSLSTRIAEGLFNELAEIALRKHAGHSMTSAIEATGAAILEAASLEFARLCKMDRPRL